VDSNYWGDLDPSYATCEVGKAQSPIQIESGIASKQLRPLMLQYKSATLALLTHDPYLWGNFTEAGYLNFQGSNYKLLKLAIHIPAEHVLGKIRGDFEIELYHENENSEKLGVAVIGEIGNKNDAFDRIGEVLAKGIHKVNLTNFSVMKLLPRRRNYFFYEGSETVPPCKEGVKWIVLEEPISMSEIQLVRMEKSFKDTARPLQPVHGRLIQKSH
jgi:carbonic anhydrase